MHTINWLTLLLSLQNIQNSMLTAKYLLWLLTWLTKLFLRQCPLLLLCDGVQGNNGLPVRELKFLNKLSSTSYQSYWTNPVEFAQVWAACVGCQCGLPVLIPSGKLAKDFARLELHYMYVLSILTYIETNFYFLQKQIHD